MNGVYLQKSVPDKEKKCNFDQREIPKLYWGPGTTTAFVVLIYLWSLSLLLLMLLCSDSMFEFTLFLDPRHCIMLQ
jgi:hypothetical protein